jgi:hypothetical protein
MVVYTTHINAFPIFTRHRATWLCSQVVDFEHAPPPADMGVTDALKVTDCSTEARSFERFFFF